MPIGCTFPVKTISEYVTIPPLKTSFTISLIIFKSFFNFLYHENIISHFKANKKYKIKFLILIK